MSLLFKAFLRRKQPPLLENLSHGKIRYFSSDNNTSKDESQTKSIPRLRILPRKRNTTPLAVAIVAIPLVAVGFRAYRDPSFYETLQSYVPLLPSRKVNAHQSPIETNENNSMTTSSSPTVENSQSSDDPPKTTRQGNEKDANIPSPKEENDNISKAILQSLYTFSQTMNEEMNQQQQQWHTKLDPILYHQESGGGNTQEKEWMTSKESPMSIMLHKLQDENMTMDQLKQQIHLLIAQLEEQNRWEAFRIQEAIRAQALQDQQELEKRKQEMQQYYNEKFVEEWKWIQQEMERRLEEQLNSGYESIESQVRKEMEEKLAKQSEQLSEEYEQRKKDLVEEMDARLKGILEQERKNRLRMLENLQVQVRALRNQFIENSHFQQSSSYAHRISCIAYGLEGLLEANNQPFSKELEKMKRIVADMKQLERDDQISDVEMLKYLILTIPKEAAEKGIPSEAELVNRFHKIVKYLRHAALIPDEKVSSIWSHMVAYVISWLKIPEKGLAQGNDAESKISRAEYFITKHNLLQAVRELEGLNGLCAELASDWIALARWRVVVKQAVQVSRAFVVLEEEALA